MNVRGCDSVGKKNLAIYLLERVYPYGMALIAVLCCEYFNFNMMLDKGYSDVLDGLVTLDSIIIGFIGAIMPVILSMKNDSKFVKYVFENDTKNLFCKYLKTTLLLGICNVIITLIMHVTTTIPKEWRMKFYYVWIFITIAFLTATYRSMSYMITLIFSKDEECCITSEMRQNEKCEISEERSNELRQKYKNKDSN